MSGRPRRRTLTASTCAKFATGLLAVTLLAVGLLAVGSGVPARAATPPIAAYSLAAPTSTAASGLVARAVIAAGVTCPHLRATLASGRTVLVRMAVRTRPPNTSPAFDSVTVCSAHVPTHATRASVGGVDIPARLPARVTRLALLGDSGCRIATYEVQDCADNTTWPLARVSSAVAAERPDAIIFNGDFFYRETACPASNQAWCGSSPPPVTGMPFTDSAYGWIADVLLPMAPMFGAAPMVVTRGNHEACYRGGNGFFYFMDPIDGSSATCSPQSTSTGLTAAATLPSTTYAIDLPVTASRTLRLAVADSAGGSDTAVSPYASVQRGAYERAAQLTAPRADRESWLLTHRPIYGLVSTAYASPGAPFSPWTSHDQGAAAWGLLDTFDLVFSSHLHLAEVVQLPGLPAQMVLGNAGTKLDPATGYPLPTASYVVGADETYPLASWAWVKVEFGYALATPGAGKGQWMFDMRDVDARTFARCSLQSRELRCSNR